MKKTIFIDEEQTTVVSAPLDLPGNSTQPVPQEPEADPVVENGKLYVYPESLPPEKQKKRKKKAKKNCWNE